LSTLHIAIDEAGNFAFSPKGSRVHVFGVAWTFDPEPLATEITRLRFSLLKRGIDLQAFHASTDEQKNRNAFVQAIATIGKWKFAGLVVEKAKVNPSIRRPEAFYPRFLCSLLSFVFRGSISANASRLAIFTDTLPLERNRESVQKAIKTFCRSEMKGKPFEIFHHCDESNCWLQVADYCTWAFQRKWEMNDSRTYNQLNGQLHATELDALQAGVTRYY